MDGSRGIIFLYQIRFFYLTDQFEIFCPRILILPQNMRQRNMQIELICCNSIYKINKP